MLHYYYCYVAVHVEHCSSATYSTTAEWNFICGMTFKFSLNMETKKGTFKTCVVSLTDTAWGIRNIWVVFSLLSVKVSTLSHVFFAPGTLSRNYTFKLSAFVEIHGDKYYFLQMRHFECIASLKPILRLASFAVVINRADLFRRIFHQTEPFSVRTWTSHASSIRKTHAIALHSLIPSNF